MISYKKKDFSLVRYFSAISSFREFHSSWNTPRDRLSSSIRGEFHSSCSIPRDTLSSSGAHRIISMAKAGHQIPSDVGKFVNHLMVGGKKGAAVGLFADSLRFFLKGLQEEKKVTLPLSSGRVSVPYPLKRNSFSKGLIPFSNFKKSPYFWQRPTATLLGLASCLATPNTKGRRNSSLKILDLRRLSILLPFSSTYQRLLTTTKRSLEKDGTSNASVIQPSMSDGVRFPFTQKISKRKRLNSPSLLTCLKLALGNVEPSLEVRKKQIAGVTRQIPCIVSKSRGEGLAIRWIIDSARERRRKGGKGFSECLAEELVDAYYKRGEPRQKRDSLHKLAESNRSFLRYRWW